MSKTKEQCLDLIGKKFEVIEDRYDFYLQLEILEEMIKEISGAEYGFLCHYDGLSNTISYFSNQEMQHYPLETSIVKEVLTSKKGFFDNHIISHKYFNAKIDNPLNIKLKSLLIVPILIKGESLPIGCLVAMRSVASEDEFKRYDVRCLGFLNTPALKTLSLANEKKEPILDKKINFNELKLREQDDANSIKSLSLKLEEQNRKIEELEAQIALKESPNKKQLVVVGNNREEEYSTQLNTVLSFLTNEVTYLANDEHKIYLFLEIIKNSLHNKEQLRFIDTMLESSELIPKLANELYSREKMPLLFEKFNLFQLIDDLVNMYGRRFSEKEITFNTFLDPTIPTYFISEMLKIKSLIIHLLNNIYGLTEEQGSVDIHITYKDTFLYMELKSMTPDIKKNIQTMFNAPKISHSLTSSDSGLGLSISSNLINMLGGKLKLTTLENENHSFLVSIPIEVAENQSEKFFIPKKVMKVVIFLSEENHNASRNLLLYFKSFGIGEHNISLIMNPKEIRGDDSTYLFCFDNMLSKVTTLHLFSDVIVLKHSREEIDKLFLTGQNIYQIYINSYYGVELQKLFYPEVSVDKFLKRTLLSEDTFLIKFNSMVKRLKLI